MVSSVYNKLIVQFQVERKQFGSVGALRFYLQGMPNSECLVPTDAHYQKLLASGFEDYTQKNCIYYHFSDLFPHCDFLNLNGYSSSRAEGLTLKFY